MSATFFTAAAKNDIRSIWRYIARDSVRYADLVIEAILTLASLPPSGLCWTQKTRVVRTTHHVSRRQGIRLIVYAEDSDPLRILRVLRGARNFPKQFRS